MSDSRRNRLESTGFMIAVGAITAISAWFMIRDHIGPYVASLVDPDREKNEQARLKAEATLARISRSRQPVTESDGFSDEAYSTDKPAPLVLNEYENQVALEVVAPEDIPVGFSDIGGLEDIIEELKESIIYPLTMPHLYAHGGALLAAPSGVLLYGPPGCGKTMLAKAVAHESKANFINLHISTLTDKWYGDSNKLVRAVFSLAHKLQPAIIFIDEIDAVLGTRRSGEHEASGMVKAEFMTLWDGLTSTAANGTPARIVVLGATNRINDIDEAILRRMPKKFAVSLPGKEQRRRILQLILGETERDPEHFDIDFIAKVTQGMSGSDLKEACRDAAMVPVRESLRQQRASGEPMTRMNVKKVRGIRNEDFFDRLGGQTLKQTPSRRTSTVAQIQSKSSTDLYEDVEDGVTSVESLG
ncbi:P-loop containing nucleoside triphosphate hydrolase protein [Lasiosphaeris hirsuta]|uniref:P-loop containing nucleoside triphosphate hydrolase protein n=1 Tax=Lasiosphaeris hirsuta TaxID=260670 RepID=A0AA40AFT4_9PEZI|nr:P-loop containing nucleoside triphosphate hydrolase protein [Lasiosphaeris hirsuta]